MNVKLKLRIGNIWKIDNICFKYNVVFLKLYNAFFTNKK